MEKILTAARRLFLEKGYEKTTIQDIVDQLGGLTKGAVYHHFKSKEEIMNALTTKMFFPADFSAGTLTLVISARRPGHRSVKKMCRRHIFSVGPGGYAAGVAPSSLESPCPL